MPLEFANSCDQPIFYTKSCYRIKTWKNTIAYAGKMYKTCACKGIGDFHATHSITVCTIEENCIYKIVAFKVRMQLGCVDTAKGFGICKKNVLLLSQETL